MSIVATRPNKHRNGAQPRQQSVLAARNGAVQQVENRHLLSSAWLPLPGSTPAPLESRKGCAWPVTQNTPHLFCNEPVPEGRYPYCAHHLNCYLSKETAA
jgi:hypothetical protein